MNHFFLYNYKVKVLLNACQLEIFWSSFIQYFTITFKYILVIQLHTCLPVIHSLTYPVDRPRQHQIFQMSTFTIHLYCKGGKYCAVPNCIYAKHKPAKLLRKETYNKHLGSLQKIIYWTVNTCERKIKENTCIYT